MRTKQLTPKIAQNYLSNAGPNRPIDRRHIASLVADIEAGFWLAPTMLVVTKDGVLLDGFHRCYAVIESGTAIPIIEIIGTEEMFDALDQGKKRNLSQILHTKGYGYTTDLASAINASAVIIDFIRTGVLRNSPTADGGSRLLTARERMNVLRSHPDLVDHVPVVSQIAAGATVPVPRGILSALRSAARAVEAEDEFDSFVAAVAIGDALKATSPEFQLRARLLKLNATIGSLNFQGKYGLWTKTWVLSYMGETTGNLRFSPKAPPIPIGAMEWTEEAN